MTLAGTQQSVIQAATEQKLLIELGIDCAIVRFSESLLFLLRL